MFLRIISPLSLVTQEFSLIILGKFQSGLKEKSGLGCGKAAGIRVGRYACVWFLAPLFLAGSLGRLFASDFLLCKLGGLKYLFSRAVMKTK